MNLYYFSFCSNNLNKNGTPCSIPNSAALSARGPIDFRTLEITLTNLLFKFLFTMFENL